MLSSILRSPRNRRQSLYWTTFFLVIYLIRTETALLGYRPRFNEAPSPTKSTSDGSQGSFDNEPRILLVSGLFPLTKSKHTHDEYDDWLSRFLGSITTPVYFYTTPSLVPTVLSKRGSHPIFINDSFTSPFDVPPLRGLQNTYKHFHTLDREASLHNPELYAVWNAKPWLLDSAVQQLRNEGQEYDYAFWNDAGSFRSDHHYAQWPDPKRVAEIWQASQTYANEAGYPEKKEDILFYPLTGTYSWLRRYWKESDGPIDAEISEASFFGGSPGTIYWWSKVYYTYHDYYLEKGYFVGKDQTLTNSLFLLFSSRIIGVWISDPATRTGLPRFDSGPMGACGSTWFYYQFFLASDQERIAMRDKWMRDLENWIGWPWKDWKWWLRRQECKPAQFVWMRDMVNDAFGKG